MNAPIDDGCRECGARPGISIEIAGPEQLWWRDGQGTLFVLTPDNRVTERNVESMSPFRRLILRAWLVAMTTVVDGIEVADTP